MPPKVKTPEERQAERKIIIKNAVKLFSDKGYEGLTMRALANECGFSSTKIYYYFSSKDELYFCIMKDGYEIAMDKLRTAYCNGKNPEERLINVADEILRFGAEYPNYYRLMLSDKMPRREDFVDTPLFEAANEATEIGLGYHDFWCKTVKEACDYYDIPVDDYISGYLYCGIHGCINLIASRVMPLVNADFEIIKETMEKELRQWLHLQAKK